MENLLYELSSFTYNGTNGNLAGVILDAAHLTNDERQLIASKHSYSEIAFVEPSEVADFKLTFFTPNSEVDLCGHATIAALGLLKQLNKIANGTFKLELKAGIVTVFVEDNNILMEQISPQFKTIIDKSIIAKSLKINETDFLDLNCQMVSTGLFDIIVPIVDRQTLNAINPNFKLVANVSKQFDTVGYHLFTIEDQQIYTRNFAPLYEINEECATGSASGALACYLYQNGLLKLNTTTDFYQGEAMQQLSKISVKLEMQDQTIIVYVGGSVSNYRIVK